MSSSDAYGGQLIDALGFDQGPAHITRYSRDAIVAVTVGRLCKPSQRPTRALAREEAFLAEIQLGEEVRRELWLDGRPEKTLPLLKGEVCIHDLRRETVYQFRTSADSMFFYLPRRTLDFIADGANAPRVTDVLISPVGGISDPTLATIARALLPSLEHNAAASRLFSDQVTMAAAAHIAENYFGMKLSRRHERGGLASWQERRAKEMMSTCTRGEVPIAVLASECELSAGHFSRLFKKTTGLAPHQWLLKHRIGTAKAMLHETQQPISEIALACGFSDQSHFTRMYTRLNGESPGTTRRATARMTGPDRRSPS
jgi:AraC family transcriptional regulator